MSDNNENSFGSTVKPNADYGIWTLSEVFNVPDNQDVGPSNRFPFNTLVSGTFADYSTSGHQFTVTRKGLYAMSWDGELTGTDVSGGTQRQALIQMTTSGLPTISKEACIMHGVPPSISCFGVMTSRVLLIGDVIEFGMAQNGTIDLPFKASTTLRITLVQEYS